MTLKDLLRKKEKVQHREIDTEPEAAESSSTAAAPEFKFIRTTTTTEEPIAPPSFPGDTPPAKHHGKPEESSKRRSRFRKSSNVSQPDATPSANDSQSVHSPPKEHSKSPRREHRLSGRLHLGARSRTTSSSSVNLPSDLPDIEGDVARDEEQEAQWVKRATILAKGTSIIKADGASTNVDDEKELHGSMRGLSVSDQGGDVRLHKTPEYTQQTGDVDPGRTTFKKRSGCTRRAVR